MNKNEKEGVNNRNYRNGRFTFGRFSIRKYGLGCLSADGEVH